MKGIILVDDHLIIGESISHFFANNTLYNFIGYYASLAEVEKVFTQQKIDVILLDISMPVLNGIKLCSWIKANYSETKVIFFTMHYDELIIARALKAGGDGYLTKNGSFSEILTAIEAVLNGERYYSKDIEQILLKRQKAVPADDLPILSPREIDVLKLIIKGFSSKEIGDKLFISAKTVEFHRSNLLVKFDARNMAQLASEAIRMGIV